MKMIMLHPNHVDVSRPAIPTVSTHISASAQMTFVQTLVATLMMKVETNSTAQLLTLAFLSRKNVMDLVSIKIMTAAISTRDTGARRNRSAGRHLKLAEENV